MATGTFDRIQSPGATDEGWRASLRRALRARTYSVFSDQNLVLRTRAGDSMAFDALVSRFRDRLQAMALNYLGDAELADDALGEAVLSAFRDVGSLDARRAPGAWLYLHGLHAVFKRMNAPAGRFTPGSHVTTGAASGQDD